MATAFKDYYSILGIDKGASQKDIKSAFRKLARKSHPDLNPNDAGAEARFKELNEANEVLSDPEKRKKYDEYGPRWHDYEAWERAGKPGRGPFAGSGGSPFANSGGTEYRTMSPEDLEEMFGDSPPFSDFFQSMFGGDPGAGGGGSRFRRPPSQRGDDVEGAVTISLEDAAAGSTVTFEMQEAAGTRRVEVKIPQGIRDGARVRAAGQGSKGGGGGAAGDLYVRVNIRPHRTFTREGDNLRTSVAVPLEDALLGGDVRVQTISGRHVQLKVPRGTQNGQVLRLKGLGMPHLKGPGKGDLLAEVDVRLPVPLTPELERWAESMPGRRGGTPAATQTDG
jgi:DnaJ-class molecular chaperone